MSGFIPVDACEGGGSTSGMPVAPTNGLYQAEGSNWIPLSQTTSDTAFLWSSDTTKTDPGAGKIKGNNADLSLITEIYLSGVTQNGATALEIWKGAARGDFAYISYSMDNSNYILLQANDYSVDEGGWVSISVNVVDSNGAIPDEEAITLNIIPTSPRANAIGIERLLDGVSLASNQQPTGEGEGNSIFIEFGAAQGSVSDAVMIDANGMLTFNNAGLYRVKVTLMYGRQGGASVSELRFRALVNGSQAGQSIGVEIDNANTSIPFSDEAWLYLPAGITIQYEVMRDSSGNNSGGLFQPAITAATAPSWNDCTCAAIRVERWSNT